MAPRNDLKTTNISYHAVVQAMDSGYLLADVIFDDRGRAIDIEYLDENPAAVEMVGSSLVGKRLRETSPDYEEYWYDIWGRVASSGVSQHLQRYAAPQGKWFDFHVFKPDPGDTTGRRIAVVFRDVTQNKHAEAVLRESEARLRAVLEQVPLAIVFTGPSGEILFRNPVFDQLWGRPAHVTTAETYSDVYEGFHLDGRPIASTEWPGARAVLQGEVVQDEVLEIVQADGRRIACWFAAGPIRDGDGRIAGGVVLFRDVSGEQRTRTALRESEERQAFLLRLSDALRPLTEAGDIERAATRLLGEHLGADRCFLSPVDEDGLGMSVREEYLRAGASSVLGEYTFAQFGDFVGPELHAGHVLAIEDVPALPGLSPAERTSYETVGIGAYLLVPLVRDGRLAAFLTVNHRTPRPWSAADRAVARQTADRLWTARERGRVEEALRVSEERFRQFATASSDALWIRDAATLHMEYVSPAVEKIYGVPPDAIAGPVENWTDLIVAEDRDVAVRHLEQARHGEAVVHEFRITRQSDGEQRWIRNTDFPLRDAEGRVQRIGGLAEDVTEDKRATDRLEVLVNELQHRARNLLGVINSVASRTLKRGSSIEAFQDRLQALSRAQGLLSEAGSDTVEVGALVRAELAAYADSASARTSVGGPHVALTARQVQNFALALHELTTNAVKYGALADGTGHLSITWEVVPGRQGRRRIALSWVESGVVIEPDRVTRRGFGTELIQEALAYALQAKVDYELGPNGVRCRIEMPIA